MCYCQIIDIASTGSWEKFVFDDTFNEFLMQSQPYNSGKKYATFAELLQFVPNADKLHYLVSISTVNYLKQLAGKIPDIVNALGKVFLPFENYRFEIINSDLRDKTKHQVAINFYSPDLEWHETIGEQLLISLPQEDRSGEILTEQFSMQPFLSVYSIKAKNKYVG